MEEDNLLGEDIHHEQDLRLKLQRGTGGEGGIQSSKPKR
jgi:hypothetical protein